MSEATPSVPTEPHQISLGSNLVTIQLEENGWYEILDHLNDTIIYLSVEETENLRTHLNNLAEARNRLAEIDQ